MGMNNFAPFSTINTTFVVKNITADRQKTIKIFNYPILYNQTRDLLKIPGVSEADIRASLLKGELNHKIRALDIEITASDIDLLQFNSDQKTFLQNAGVVNGLDIAGSSYHDYPAAATDPIGAVNNGDRYYNLVLQETMNYDADRLKWLSISDFSCTGGRLDATAPGSFYRGMDNLAFGTNIGNPVPKGTLVGLSYSKTDANTSTVEVLIGGIVIATLASSAAGQVISNSENADFNVGLLQFRNSAASAATDNVQIVAWYKKRI